MTTWYSYTQGREKHTVLGDLCITENVHSSQLDNERNLLVWLPPSYATTDKRFPVLYMHDGDNLFDAHATIYGEWQVDETLTTLADEGMEAIVVGIPNIGHVRFSEYSPFEADLPGVEDRILGLGDAYLSFIIDSIKPMIDAEFRTLPDSANTCIAGSSMGGLISLYGFLKHPDVFGMCGSFSPVFWIKDDALLQTVQAHATGHGRVYLDVGTQEGEVYAYLTTGQPPVDDVPHHAYRDGVRHLRDGLLEKGYTDNLLYVEDEGALHNEFAWAKRLPEALRFLFKDQEEG